MHRVLLHQAGLIAPRIRGADHGAADLFAAADLDAFLDRLLAGAAPVAAASDGQDTIPDAAKKACCGAEAIVRLAIDGKLAHKWKLAGERGCMSLLVDVEEIRALVRGADHGGFTGKALQGRQQTTDRVIRNLIAGGHVKTETVVNPSTGVRSRSCSPAKSSVSSANSYPCSCWRSSRDGISGR